MEAPGMLNFGMASAFEGVSGSDFSGLTVSIAVSFLIRQSDILGLPLPDDFLDRPALPVRRQLAALRQITCNGRSLLYRQSAPFGALEQKDFVAGLISAAADAEPFDDKSTLFVRARAVRRAVDTMRERAGEDLPISEICSLAGVSWRTLDRGFKEQFGIGPKAYLNRIRLGHTRSALLRKRPESSVADIANEWGFWHMGQFAKDYRRFFGELPSATAAV